MSLAGCAPSTTLAVFDRDQTASDTLPADGTPNVIESVDATSTRLLLDDEGTRFFAAKGTGSTADQTCLVLFEGTEGTSACSTGPVTIELQGSPAYMLADAASDSDRWTKVADYLYVEN